PQPSAWQTYDKKPAISCPCGKFGEDRELFSLLLAFPWIGRRNLPISLSNGIQMKAAVLPSHTLSQAYAAVRAHSVALAAPLSAEDCTIQSMPDASPVKWHLAHTTWFFENLILAQRPGYKPFDPRFAYLFNSYYEALGPRH